MTHRARDRLRNLVRSTMEKCVGEPALLVHDPSEVSVIVAERCRGLTCESLDAAERHVLVIYVELDSVIVSSLNIPG